jgi:hypothetical protein
VYSSKLIGWKLPNQLSLSTFAYDRGLLGWFAEDLGRSGGLYIVRNLAFACFGRLE